MIDSIMLCGFGGPTPGCCGRRSSCPGSAVDCFEADCFVRKVLGDPAEDDERVSEVVAHYRHFGGYSPYNQRSEAQRQALSQALAARGLHPAICLGFRNWPPWYADGWRQLAAQGCRRTLLVVLAPHQGKRSWDDYLAEAAAARDEVADAPEIAGHSEPIGNHPGFIAALIHRAQAQRDAGSDAKDATTGLLLTAHAIPQAAERGAYRPQVEATAAALRRDAGFAHCRLGFQSAPSSSRIPWSSPTVAECLADLAAAGCHKVVALPIGFLVDHMEVLYDLDVELAAQAQSLGITLRRARSVEDHPEFINALAERISEAAERLG